MTFRLWTIFYVFALFAAAMATFGGLGVIAASTVLGFWAILFSAPQGGHTKTKLVVVVIVLLVLAALFLPAIGVVREFSRRGACLNNVRQLALALTNYESKKSEYPRVAVVDAGGSPLYSWRVTLMASLDRSDIAESMDLSKTWNDPANVTVTTKPLDVLQCPENPTPGSGTDYVAIVGPRTMWPGAVARKTSEVKDERASTIVLIESRDTNSNWAEPRELSFDEAVDLLSSRADQDSGHFVENGMFHLSGYGRAVAFADGHVAFIRDLLPRELAAALLTVDGGEDVTAELRSYENPIVDYGKWYGLSVFLMLSVLPAWWFRKRKDTRMTDEEPRSKPGAEPWACVRADLF